MAARVIQVQNEDGILETQVEYYTPLKKMIISKEAKAQFTRVAALATTQVHENLACVFCHADSQFRTDVGTMCEHHLLASNSWQEAIRI